MVVNNAILFSFFHRVALVASVPDLTKQTNVVKTKYDNQTKLF